MSQPSRYREISPARSPRTPAVPRAAWLAAQHANTPTLTVFDSLGAQSSPSRTTGSRTTPECTASTAAAGETRDT